MWRKALVVNIEMLYMDYNLLSYNTGKKTATK